MLCDIVIAHYNENLKWVNYLKHKNIRNINIYNKKSKTKIFTKQKFISQNHKIINISLPNIGRESHTYLTYCIDHYHSLPDFVFFLQGDPEAHGFGYKQIIHYLNNLNKNIKYTKNFSLNSVYLGLDNEHIYNWAHSKTEPSEYSMTEWFHKYIASENINLNKCYICFGANFGVSKDRILSRTKEELITIKDMELSSINPEAGHFIERSWFYLFNLHHVKNFS